MTAYDALIVDFGGVLTTPLQDAMLRFAVEAGIELQDFARAALGVYSGGEDELVVGFETGRMGLSAGSSRGSSSRRACLER
jgi:hypothetical protein